MPDPRDTLIESIADFWSDMAKLFLLGSAIAVLLCRPWVKGMVL